VVENHLFQVIALLAMEPPAFQSFQAVHSAKASVLRAMLPLKAGDLVRGQYIGYRDEQGVASDSDVETFCALRLFIDSWRWAGVPWYVRAGKRLPASVVEVQVQMQPPPQRLFDDSGPAGGRANYFRFRLQPEAGIALAARIKRPGKEFVGIQRELYLGEDDPETMSTYERLLGDAMAGDDALFTDEDAVMAAWTVVEPVLGEHGSALPYQPGTWGPAEAAALIAGDGGWHDPETGVLTPSRPAERGVQ
jgi:glucose-6-phosphate 1-dehydrogenase